LSYTLRYNVVQCIISMYGVVIYTEV